MVKLCGVFLCAFVLRSRDRDITSLEKVISRHQSLRVAIVGYEELK